MRVLVKVVVYLLLSCRLFAEEPAGIVLYFQDEETTYLLLADEVETSRGWSAFGGGGDTGEKIEETAARETEEETRGYFQQEWLLQKLENQKPVRSRGYNMFFVEVPFVPAIRVQQNPLKAENGNAYRERVHFAWVPVSDLENALKADNRKIKPEFLPSSSPTKSYWEIWVANMRDAYEQEACPWQKN